MQNQFDFQVVSSAALGAFTIQRGDRLRDIFSRKTYKVEGVYKDNKGDNLFYGYYDDSPSEKVYLPARNFEMLK